MKLTKQEWLGKYKNMLKERDYKLLSLAYDILEENTLQGSGYPWGEYAVISPWSQGAGIWNWDTAFHAMGVSRYDTGLAKSCLEGFMQFQKKDGMFPDVIRANGEITDDLSKPPFLPWAVMLTYRRDGNWDKNFLSKAYERFVKNEAFMMRERQEGGLFFYSSQEDVEKDNYLHARWESGWDNSPRWDKPIVNYWAIDLNCAMVMTYRALAEMAEELREGKDMEKLWNDKAKALSARIEAKMFHEKEGYYSDTDRRTGEHSSVLTPSSFMPLYIGIASAEHAEKMHLLASDETKFYPGMPTVAYDDPTYSRDYWRGPTWLNVAYFAVAGLEKYGYTKTAGEIREFLLDMIEKNSANGIFENYDSKAGEGLCWPHFSWSCAFTIQFILDAFDGKNLVPDIVNPSPDYYCTWQTQLYATCGGKPTKQRAIIGERALFENEKPFGWAHFYEQVRRDLFLVMDDSWDVPKEDDPAYYGSLILNKEKFPVSTKHAADNGEALENLAERVHKLGWKGLGGWVCAQESKIFQTGESPEDYWKTRFIEADRAGFSYWKVDWGEHSEDSQFRKMLTELGHSYAPRLMIEHAIIQDVIPYADVFRTYDVPAIMSIPMTLEKLSLLEVKSDADGNGMAIINCEDEAYIAAAGGFSMGIMRHPYTGAFLDGKADMSFPSIHRNLKTKMFEVIRAARWHRVAPAFGVTETPILADEVYLTDTWKFDDADSEIEKWWFNMPAIRDHIRDNVLTKTAPARLSRGTELPEVIPDENGRVPYVVAACNPNGAFSVATLGRTMDRQYFIPECQVTVESNDATVIGVFGEYKSLVLKTTFADITRILMQDLADDIPQDITGDVKIEDGNVVIPGKLIHAVGTQAQSDTDTSEPGVILYIE